MKEALETAGITLLQAVRLALDLVETGRVRQHRGGVSMRQCREMIQLGCEQWRARRHSVSFSVALRDMLAAKSRRRQRTVAEIKSVCGRLLRGVPGLGRRRVSGITAQQLAEMLEQVFPTQRQRAKARVILHGLFAHCRRRGWLHTGDNPAAMLRYDSLEEKEIVPLAWEQIQSLLGTARRARHRPCMAALGLMLWAGIRPAEVTRLSWADIDSTEGVVAVHPQHSKTGGCRHVHICPALKRWLAHCPRPAGGGRVCPPNWQRRWKRLRTASGIIPWPQDVLRHTFASYHAKHFRNFPLLQLEMGHRSAALLRSRYLSMRGITAAHAAAFWK